MELSEAIAGRRAVREYTTEAVDETVICRLIDDAVQAPSAINEQPWVFTVVRDQALLDRTSDKAKAHLRANTPAASLQGKAGSMLENTQYQIFYHAPVLVLISASAGGDWALEDCTLAAENLMLAAYAEGLGSCWIGLAQAYLKTPEGRAAFQLPAAYEPVAPIILGHPKASTPRVARHPPEIHWL